MKVCVKCNIEREEDCFEIMQSGNLRVKCKICRVQEHKNRIIKNVDLNKIHIKEKKYTTQICNLCHTDQKLNNFERTVYKSGNVIYRKQCNLCRSIQAEKQHLENYQTYIARSRERYKNKKLKQHESDTEFKICTQCNINKNVLTEFNSKITKTGYVSVRAVCKQCVSENEKQSKLNYYNKSGKFKNRTNSQDPIAKQKRNERLREKRKDPVTKLRISISAVIRTALQKQGVSKNNLSCLKYLSYTIAELKQHLGSLFESWMTWENWGVYNSKTWNDNDPSTWTWQIDHIIPHSTLPYTSMEDENFKKCWALENLRPYSAKQNNIDGGSKIRHKQKTQ